MFATTADVAALRGVPRGASASRGAVVTVAKESRIGKAPVKVPKGVTVKVDGNTVSAKARRPAPLLSAAAASLRGGDRRRCCAAAVAPPLQRARNGLAAFPPERGAAYGSSLLNA